MLIIAHRLSTIRHANQIVVLDGGRVAEIGTHDELITRPDGQYNKMWAMQVNGAAASSAGGLASRDSGLLVSTANSSSNLSSMVSSQQQSPFEVVSLDYPAAIEGSASVPGKITTVPETRKGGKQQSGR